MEYETAVQYLCVLIMPLPKPSVITIAGQNLGTGHIGAPLKSKDGGISLDRIRPTRPLPRLFLSMTLDTEHSSASDEMSNLARRNGANMLSGNLIIKLGC